MFNVSVSSNDHFNVRHLEHRNNTRCHFCTDLNSYNGLASQRHCFQRQCHYGCSKTVKLKPQANSAITKSVANVKTSINVKILRALGDRQTCARPSKRFENRAAILYVIRYSDGSQYSMSCIMHITRKMVKFGYTANKVGRGM